MAVARNNQKWYEKAGPIIQTLPEIYCAIVPDGCEGGRPDQTRDEVVVRYPEPPAQNKYLLPVVIGGFIILGVIMFLKMK
jgi:hypothetical protein